MHANEDAGLSQSERRRVKGESLRKSSTSFRNLGPSISSPLYQSLDRRRHGGSFEAEGRSNHSRRGIDVCVKDYDSHRGQDLSSNSSGYEADRLQVPDNCQEKGAEGEPLPNGSDNEDEDSVDQGLLDADRDAPGALCWRGVQASKHKVGLIYGSLTEDITTGTKIHSRGWGSIACTPSPPAFIGLAPSTIENILVMRERWATGMLQFLFSHHFYLLVNSSNGMSLFQRIVYIYIYTYNVPSFFLFVYALLPGFSMVQGGQFYPQIGDRELVIPMSLLMCYYIGNLYETKLSGVGVKEWWNSEMMETIIGLTSNTVAFYEVLKNKVIGSEQTTFSVTPKEPSFLVHDEDQEEADQGFVVKRYLSIFIPATVVVLLNMISLVVAVTRTVMHLTTSGPAWNWLLSTELACSLWILYNLKPFSKGVVFWASGQEGPMTLSSSTILYASCIVMALLSLFLISTL